MRRWKPAAAAVGGVAIAAGAWLASGEPRLTLVNNAMLFDHPWSRGAAALAAAGGAGLLAALAPRAWARVALGLIAAFGLWTSLDLFRYRVVSSRDRLAVRSALGETSLTWSDVVSVDNRPPWLVVTGQDAELRVNTGRFRAEDRASLERNVASNLALPAPRPAPTGTPAVPPVSKP